MRRGILGAGFAAGQSGGEAIVAIPFNKELAFEYGVAEQVSPLIRRVVADNPGAFTLFGTGTYIVGRERVAVIDPGPDDAAHVAALLRALEGQEVSHIVVTHTHRDHSPAAKPLQAATGAPIWGCGPHGSGRPEHAGEQVEEGGDAAYAPDRQMADGEALEGDGWTLEAVWTPGHTSNHLCFRLAEEDALFSGDHVMGWSTTIVSPPDGDMRRYMASLKKLIDRAERRYWPTHGAPIEQPQGFVAQLLEHRHERERQILACLKAGTRTIPAMVARMYTDVPQFLHKAAARSVLSHIINMTEDGRLRVADGTLGPDAVYDLPA
jgi:glyoxylase-like metal-dependent hydrolase (beta-lactamase superfamily II)